jgi:hypothetical protein
LDCAASTTSASTAFSNPIRTVLNWTTTPNAVQAGKLYGVIYTDNALPTVQNVVYTDSTKITLLTGTHAGIAAGKNYTYSLKTYCDNRLQWTVNTGIFNTNSSSASKSPLTPEGGIAPQPPTGGKISLSEGEGWGGASLQVYPNPANAEVTVSLATPLGAGGLELVILDMLGREVYKTNNFGGNLTLNTKAFASGTYLVKVNEGGKVMTKKLVVE